jgi:hypothetical protein
VISQQLTQVRSEWRRNMRLRIGVMAIFAIAGGNLVLMLSRKVDSEAKAYSDQVEMLTRLESLKQQDYWVDRARQVSEVLLAVQEQIPSVNSAGLAQAESQAWIKAFADEVKIGEPRIKVEAASDVEGYPELWQVIARLDGTLPEYGHKSFLRGLAAASPWIQIERIELREGAVPGFSVTLRSYYRDESGSSAPVAVPGTAQHGHADVADSAQ